MLRKETVGPGTLELLTGIMLDEKLKNFILVGGTALALQIGHRKSLDLDLFTQEAFDSEELSRYLEASLNFRLDFISTNTIKGEANGIKVDFIRHGYPSVEPFKEPEGIRLAAIRDILAMKLNAIVGNGSRLKDFVDVAYSSPLLSLQQMLEAYEIKYQTRNPLMAMKALAYHEDINFNEPVEIMSGMLHWPAVEKRLVEMIKSPSKIFPALSIEPGKGRQNKPKL